MLTTTAPDALALAASIRSQNTACAVARARLSDPADPDNAAAVVENWPAEDRLFWQRVGRLGLAGAAAMASLSETAARTRVRQLQLRLREQVANPDSQVVAGFVAG